MSSTQDHTVVNPYKEPKEDGTKLNIAEGGKKTGDDRVFSLEKGSIIPDNFTVLGRMGNSYIGGEADLFLCEKDGKRYVARFLRREADENERLFNKLKELDSPYIAKLHKTGKMFGRYYEVYDYFEKGSLADTIKKRTFSLEELEKHYIPKLNEALHTLHKAGILHRDIKSANMMWSNEEDETLVLIDFGLSSVTSSSQSIVVSQIGFTASYAAPEVLRNVYFDESDYYSLGIVLYEMFTGKTPFGDENSYTSVISRPGNMPKRLYRLILGLTYPDISYRHDASYPNRRWTYEEVLKWLSGKEEPVPGQGAARAEEDDNPRAITPIYFCEEQYDDIDRLVYAMGLHWQEGKRLLFNGLLSTHLRSSANATEAQLYYASIIEGILGVGKMNSDVRMTKILYTLSTDCKLIFCPMGVYESIEEWGKAMFTALETGAGDSVTNAPDSVETVLLSKTLSEFIKRTSDGEDEESPESGSKTKDLIAEFEKRVTEHSWQRQKESYVYEFLYRLTGKEEFNPGLPDDKVFFTVEEMKDYIKKQKSDRYGDLYRTMACFLIDEHQMKPALYGWLKSKGVTLPGFNDSQ